MILLCDKVYTYHIYSSNDTSNMYSCYISYNSSKSHEMRGSWYILAQISNGSTCTQRLSSYISDTNLCPSSFIYFGKVLEKIHIRYEGYSSDSSGFTQIGGLRSLLNRATALLISILHAEQ